MSKKKSNKNLRYAVVLALVVVIGVLFTLEKTNITNFYESSSKTATVSDQGKVNEVDYSPATTTDNADINAKKETGTVEQAPAIPTSDTNIQITFIASSQDKNSGPLEIRTLLGGVTDGNCNLTLTKDQTVVQKSTIVEQQNTYFACKAFSVPYSELANGDWQIKLKVTSGDGRINEASTSTTIN